MHHNSLPKGEQVVGLKVKPEIAGYFLQLECRGYK
jgi:hypothetical protein